MDARLLFTRARGGSMRMWLFSAIVLCSLLVSGCAGSYYVRGDAVVRAYIDALNEGNKDAFVSLYAPAARAAALVNWQSSGFPDLPAGQLNFAQDKVDIESIVIRDYFARQKLATVNLIVRGKGNRLTGQLILERINLRWYVQGSIVNP